MSARHARKKVEKLRATLRLHKLPKPIRVIVVALIGGVTLLAGIVMIVAPGPAFVFIPLGVLLLACEFKWAEPQAYWLLNLVRRGQARWRLWRRRRAGARTEAKARAVRAPVSKSAR